MKKIYVLDTNILMQSPKAIFGFDDNIVAITGTTLQELDKHKNDPGERGYNTRETVRIIDDLRTKGDLRKGVELPNKGSLLIVSDMSAKCMPEEYSLNIPDNRIISTVLGLKEKRDLQVALITNDLSMRVNATLCGAEVQSYLNESIEEKVEVYEGKCEKQLSAELINDLYSFGSIETPFDDLIENEYLILKADDDPQKSALAIHRKGILYLIKDKDLRGFNNVRGRNLSQKLLIHALLAPAEQIPLVIAKGPAGTGKTMLAIACGLTDTYCGYDERRYDQVLITRTNVLSDNDLGFLPGTLEEKMDPLVAPFMDNLQQIFAGQGKDRDLEVAKQQMDYVLQKEIVQIASVGYMRGRSIANSYLIVDEAQNMTVQQALEIVSRAGMGTKVVLLGDPDQIDARYLDKRNNGLVFTADRMKDSPLCAQITFDQEESVRSPLAMEAAKKMTI
ncbi:MAG: PhoH family protein [Lachnospiraceae bacterium]|nr:PhoH family protein [Lachnospiraceae bacterium]